MRMFEGVTIICGEDPEQAHAIRAGLEEMRLRVFVYHAVQKPHLVDFFAGKVPCSDYIVVMGACGHGKTEGEDWSLEEMGLSLPCVENRDGKFDWALTEFVLTAADVPERVHLPGKTLICSACGSGRKPFAEAFLKAGCRTYIGSNGETDQNAVNLFTLAFFYHLLTNERDPEADCTEEEAFQRAAGLDTWCRWGTHRFRYYTRAGA